MGNYISEIINAAITASTSGISQTTRVASTQIIGSFHTTGHTGSHCISYVSHDAVGGSVTEITKVSLSIHSGEGDDEIPDGFSWGAKPDSKRGHLTVSPTKASANSAVVFLRDIEDLVIDVEDNCDLDFFNKASQPTLRLSFASSNSNINLHGGQRSHALKIRTASGDVAVGKERSFLPAEKIDVETMTGDILVWLEGNIAKLSSMSGNIQGNVVLGGSFSKGTIRSNTMSSPIFMRVMAAQPIQLCGRLTSMTGPITLEHRLKNDVAWELSSTGEITVNDKRWMV